MEILSVNGFIEWSFGAYFDSFYCWLAFVFGENMCVAEEL